MADNEISVAKPRLAYRPLTVAGGSSCSTSSSQGLEMFATFA